MRGIYWLVAAGTLIGGGGWLMTQGDAGAAAHERDELAFPTHQRANDLERETVRRTLAPLDTAAAAKDAVTHDPLLVALPPDADTALVFEAGTILRAPVGQAMLACVSAEDRAHMERSVIDPSKSWLDLADRVAFASSPAGELVAVQGKLDAIDITKLAPDAVVHTYGTSAKVYDVAADDARPELHVGVWSGSLVLTSHTRGLVLAALDRLDSGGSAKLAFDEREAYGEIYGVIGQADLERLAPPELRERVHDVAAHAEVHVDAIEEVLLVMDVEGSDAKQVEDLGKSLGAALAVGRLEAKREGEDALVRLMDQSRVRLYGDRRLRAEVAVPTDIMTRSMRGCGK